MEEQVGNISKINVMARHEANKYSKSQALEFVRSKLIPGPAYFGSAVDRRVFEFLCARVGVELEWVRHDLNEGLTQEEKPVGNKRPATRKSSRETSSQTYWWDEDD